MLGQLPALQPDRGSFALTTWAKPARGISALISSRAVTANLVSLGLKEHSLSVTWLGLRLTPTY